MYAMTRRSLISGLLFALLSGGLIAEEPDVKKTAVDPLLQQPGVVDAEFVYLKAPYPECHASTLVELPATEEEPSRIVAAWFGGTEEKHPDVGIWLAHRENDGWSEAVEVADGVQHADLRYPCWNPVLWQVEKGPLLLFYKIGPSPRAWWGMLRRSHDRGLTWSHGCRLPEGILGPIRSKPELLADGSLLCGSSTEHEGWRVHFERTENTGGLGYGETWSRTPAISNTWRWSVIQPCFITKPGGWIRALCRSREDRLVQITSTDGGKTWGDLEDSGLPNPSAGTDAVTLRDGRHLLVYNHTRKGGEFPIRRNMLNVSVSEDGDTWKAAVTLERSKGGFSYPAVIQTRDGKVHITYTWNRVRIRHVTLDPQKLKLRPMDDGKWPL